MHYWQLETTPLTELRSTPGNALVVQVPLAIQMSGRTTRQDLAHLSVNFVLP